MTFDEFQNEARVSRRGEGPRLVLPLAAAAFIELRSIGGNTRQRARSPCHRVGDETAPGCVRAQRAEASRSTSRDGLYKVEPTTSSRAPRDVPRTTKVQYQPDYPKLTLAVFHGGHTHGPRMVLAGKVRRSR